MKKLFLSLFALSFAIAIFAQSPQPQTNEPKFIGPDNPKNRIHDELNGLVYSLYPSDGIAIVRRAVKDNYDKPKPPVRNSSRTNSSNSDAHPVKPTNSESRTNSPSNMEKTTIKIPGVIKVNTGEFAGHIFTVKLQSSAFKNCQNLTEVEFENTLNPETHKYVSVSCIPPQAFANCPNLKKINLHFVDYIGVQAFENCQSLEALYIGDSIVNATHQMFIGQNAFRGCINLEDVIIACKSTRQDRITVSDTRVIKDDMYKSLKTYGWMFIDEGAFENCGKLKKLSVIDIANKSELSTFCIADWFAFGDSPFTKSASYKKIAFVKDGYDNPNQPPVPVINSSSTKSSKSDAHPVKPTNSKSRTKSSKSGAHTVKSTNSNSGGLPSDAKGWYLFHGGNKIFIIYVGNNKLGKISYVNGQEDVEIGTFKYDGNALNVSFGDGVNTPLAISYRNGGWQLDLGRGCYATKSSENMVSMVYTNPRTLNDIKSYCR